MKRFTALFFELDETTRTNEKIDAIVRYFKEAAPLDAAWAIFVLAGRKIGKTVSSTLLRRWAAEESGYPGWLVDQCYVVVGDLSETISLLLPTPARDRPSLPLHEIIEERIRPLPRLTRESQREIIVSTWAMLDANERLVFHKLLGGSFRVGVSRQLLMRALAEVAGVPAAMIANRLAGNWTPDETTVPRILAAHEPGAASDADVPYPFMLAHALQDELTSLGEIADWLIEWKWDGIRAQLIRRAGKTALWSRGDELVSGAFPEIIQAASALADGTVLDGEIVAWNDSTGRPDPFTRLQHRLNRRTVEITFWPEVPVAFIAFDALEINGRDVRDCKLSERRTLLEACLQSASQGLLRPSSPLHQGTWEEVFHLIQESRGRGVEGVMLKRRDSAYRAGRPTGLWWKLKVEPFTMDAVLIAAEPGHGRRAGLLTDYTFGVWDAGTLVPVAKAYSGLTNAEIAEMDRFTRSHTIARHGPVHTVEPLLVFEIAFEAIQLSTRHKSGIAVRFPRILRIRQDKKPEEADQLQTIRSLLDQVGASR